MGAILRARGLTKTFETQSRQIEVLKDMNLEVLEGELVTVFGPNGSGKSTLLSILAGIDTDFSGTVDRSIEQHQVGMVFQSFGESLLPWKTAEENIAFPLELRGIKKDVRREKVRNLVSQCGLQSKGIPLTSLSYQLSGGQQQLVCILRAFIAKPAVLYLDEPFSALDFETRSYMTDILQKFWAESGATIVMISHDLDEAMLLGRRILLMGTRPRGIIADLSVPLPEPRAVSLIQSDEFNSTRVQILKKFFTGVN